MVHLRADDPNAVLQLRKPNPALAGVDGWEPACASPCGVLLNPEYSYRVGGAGLASSYGFTLPKGHETVTVHARAGGAGREYWGEALTLTGATSLLLGAVTLTTMFRTDAMKNNEPGDTASTIQVVCITTMALGVVMLAIGVPLRLGGGTSIRLDPPTAKTARVSLTPRGLEF
jgi:hypothetical protein